ncbi:CUE domain-containing protein 2 isoform X3 [Uranotaenia lowii]|uniref:CUE domain-containing protein 2 isoform X3 n=1 Tax=Uranotaenia lowii TaxID=190385 RepID=UPI00247A9020|nr:CUE domain-containing protein 2 isoform X3 [Uranotaenia lowii]XP_055585803.1 CUE domain-containing protein 2 isoform X3 [Uranotaenia lowii]XP_055585804.1 CUE domain-containing protein 2 isoform X3 [Uranotaenia lowii]
MTNIAQQHDIVKNSLFQFISSHIPGADLNIVDDIVLSYVISILEEASQDPCFDVEGFIEMMSAYFSDFSNIEPATVCAWIFQLESQLSEKSTGKTSVGDVQNLSLNSLCLADILPEEKLRGRQSSISEGEPAANGSACNPQKRVQHLSETSDAGSTDSSNCDLFSEECEVLQEMFPESSLIEVKHCILIANGDVDRATQILLHRQEAGQSLKGNPNNLQTNKAIPQIDETEVKNRIISRYSYVDKEDHREYKPIAPKVEPKKMIRYRDNKIVSLKGERYTEVSRRGGDDETELKKPKKPICP